MNNTGFSPFQRILSIFVVMKILLAAVICVLTGNKDDCFRKIVEIMGNDKVEMLDRLNDEWSLPEDCDLETFAVNGIAMEWVQEKNTDSDKAILQLHGGAYIHSLSYSGVTYRRTAVQYAEISGAGVLSVDYRVAPENPYPAALEDAVMAYQWLLDQGYEAENIIIAGDSAGGGLTLATTLYLRDHDMPMPAALVTMSAWTNLDYGRLSVPYVGDADATNPYISPIYGEYQEFPAMLMQAGGDEYILNDTLAVAEKAEEAGVSVEQTTYDGMFHDFQLLFPELEDANEAWAEVESFINGVFA